MRNELAQVDSLAVGSARVMEATKGNSLASGRREEDLPRVNVTVHLRACASGLRESLVTLQERRRAHADLWLHRWPPSVCMRVLI